MDGSAPGTPPSTRRLGELLGVSRGTVVDVSSVARRGYIESAWAPGRGRPQCSRRSGPARARYRPCLAFRPGRPSPTSSTASRSRLGPLTAWSWAVSEATRTLPTAEFGNDDPAGSMICVRSSPPTTVAFARLRGRRGRHRRFWLPPGTGSDLGDVDTARRRAHRARGPRPRQHDVIARRAGLDACAGARQRPWPRRRSPTGDRSTTVLLTPAHQCPTVWRSARRGDATWLPGRRGRRGDPRGRLRRRSRYDRQPVGSLQGLNPDP